MSIFVTSATRKSRSDSAAVATAPGRRLPKRSPDADDVDDLVHAAFRCFFLAMCPSSQVSEAARLSRYGVAAIRVERNVGPGARNRLQDAIPVG